MNEDKKIDYNDIRMWKNNPELVLETAWRFTWKWGGNYSDKEDLQMFIAERILKMIDKFDPSYGNSLYGQIYIAGKRAVLDYGRKYGRVFKGRNFETRVYIRESEYHEMDFPDAAEQKGNGLLNHARISAAHHDKHENFDLIQRLKIESDLTKKIIFCFYFLEMTIPEIAKELDRSEAWIYKKINRFREQYFKENYPNGKSKSSFSCLEDLPMEKLEDFYELVQNQSSLTQK